MCGVGSCRSAAGHHLLKRLRGRYPAPPQCRLSDSVQREFERSLTPNITETIGHHTRVYFALVTTAPAELDSPATVTLHGALFAEMAGFAADPITLDETHGYMSARLILVDAMELAWQRATYRGNQHQLLSADPGLVDLNTLQHWLWQRLQAPANRQVAA